MKTLHFLQKNPLLIRSPINTAKFFRPIGDQINGVPLYVFCTEMNFCTWHTHALLLSLTFTCGQAIHLVCKFSFRASLSLFVYHPLEP